MELRNYIDFVLIAAGIIVFSIGVAAFMTKRYLNKAEDKETDHTKSKGVPTDINDHSGWARGGRNRNWEESSDFSDDGGD